jgi:sec-independent protein translocase protein TatA
MGSLGAPELIVIFLLALIVFGPKKLPEMGRSIGQAMREFRKATRGFMDDIEQSDSGKPESSSSDLKKES